MKNKVDNYSYRVMEIRKMIAAVSIDALTDLQDFKLLVEKLRITASKKTHYQDLDKWSNEVHEYVGNMLKKYGFVNGNPEANALIPDVSFWWNIYCLLSNVIYSPHLVSEVSSHHSSAFERNEALIKEIDDILK
jgi:hypothetical protein